MKNVGAPAVRAARASLHIGELIIHGLPALNRHALGDAMQARLTLLLGEIDGAIADLGGSTRLAAPTVHIGADATAEQIGAEVADAVCDALVRGGRPR